MDTIIAAIIAVVGPCIIGASVWSVRWIVRHIVDLERRQAVLRHLLTQVVLRVEHLERHDQESQHDREGRRAE